MAISILFPDVAPDEANDLAETLAYDLNSQHHPELKAEVVRSDPSAQDFGTTLVLILGAPAIVIAAKAIRDWAQRKDRTDVQIGEISIKNANSADVADIIRALKTTSEQG